MVGAAFRTRPGLSKRNSATFSASHQRALRPARPPRANIGDGVDTPDHADKAVLSDCRRDEPGKQLKWPFLALTTEKNQMNNERREFLNLRNLPARLEIQEAGWYLGFAPHAIPVIIRAGLLKPLGHPARNGAKYFAAMTLAELRNDSQ